MKVVISSIVKVKIKTRANNCCEYCLLPQKYSFFNFHIDHIISLKHGGSSEFENLALSCPDCSKYKGTDLASFLVQQNNLIRFYNPRIDKWHENFEIKDGIIVGKTDIGSVTEKIFQFNEIDRLIFRRDLIDLELLTLRFKFYTNFAV